MKKYQALGKWMIEHSPKAPLIIQNELKELLEFIDSLPNTEPRKDLHLVKTFDVYPEEITKNSFLSMGGKKVEYDELFKKYILPNIPEKIVFSGGFKNVFELRINVSSTFLFNEIGLQMMAIDEWVGMMSSFIKNHQSGINPNGGDNISYVEVPGFGTYIVNIKINGNKCWFYAHDIKELGLWHSNTRVFTQK